MRPLAVRVAKLCFMTTAIHWFRRDLRITDNTALNAAVKSADAVIPVYIPSTWKKEHPWTGPMKQQFLCGCLESLSKNLDAAGGKLHIRSGNAIDILEKLVRESGATAIHTNRDPDPFGRQVEEQLKTLGNKLGIQIHVHQDAAMHERDEVVKGDGEPYRVFTPYSKAWLRLDKSSPSPKLSRITTPSGLASESVPTLAHWDLQLPEGAEIIEPGERAARKRLESFLSGAATSYEADRNTMAGQTTSRISQDLRFGLLSIRNVYHDCRAAAAGTNASGRQSINTFISELIWREFYFQILWFQPGVLDHEFTEKYRGLKWQPPGEKFQAWCDGRTGFPVVDAAMRQLKRTGFMHNRARMITAMFLTKDLQIDWREGERYFMQQLVDGEIASNNGGWQWSAGTGADAAPYFRIQNPWSQTKRFDPDGEYIRTWIPELKNVPAKKFQEPPIDGRPIAPGYPAPIVDHSTERDNALEMFRSHG